MKLAMWLGVNVRAERRLAATGELLEAIEVHNLVTDVGLNMMRDLLAGGAYPLTHVELGTGASAAAAGDTALGAPKHRAALTRREAISTGVAEFQLYVPADEGNTFDYTEVGLLEAGEGDVSPGGSGRLFARALFGSAVAKTPAIELTIIWTVTITRA